MDFDTHEENKESLRPSLGDRLINTVIFSRRGLVLLLLLALFATILSLLPPEARRLLLVSLYLQRSVVLLLLAFVLITLSLLWGAGQSFDAWLFTKINQHWYQSVWNDRLLLWLSQVGSGVFSFVLAAGAYLLNRRQMAAELALGSLTLWLVVEGVKALVERSRPFTLLAGARLVGWRERGRSFPSGHTSQAFYLAAVLAFHFEGGPLQTAVIYSLAVLVAYSRVYLGVHYPRDVLAGAVLGSVWGILTALLNPFWSSGV